MPPKTRYARNGDVNIAYQVVGDGPIDILMVPGFVSHLDLGWTDPFFVAFIRRLASVGRLILHDKRGTGLSDPVVGVPPLEQRMEDVRAVLDAAGSERATLFGISEGGPMSLLFAATYPERTTGLVLYGTFARGTPDAVHGGALGETSLRRVIDAVTNHWGDGSTLDLFGPSMAARGEREREQRGVFERAAASPSLAAAVVQAVIEIDVSDVLPSIHVPTLVLHRIGDVIPVAGGRYIAEHIPGATFVELPGDDHIPWIADSDRILDEIERFLTGTRHALRPDCVLATVLFTDIVQSTETASALGDERWRQVLEAHDRIVREQLHAYSGREVKRTGDGFLATFDGPARAIRCACSIRDSVAQHLDIEIRAGLHTGECEVIGDDIAGMAVHIGARVAAAARAGEVLASSTVRDLVVGSEIAFQDRGSHELKGAPGEWHLLAVANSAADSVVGTRTAAPTKGRSERTVLALARHAPWLMRQQAARQLRRAAKTAPA